MKYNTSRKQLVLPEYGRSIHRMVDHIKSLESKEERNTASKALVKLMAQINPQIKYAEDVEHKLWDHLYIMADYELDIEAPFSPPNREEFERKPDPLKYPPKTIKIRHYGKVIQDIITKACEFEEGEEKDALIGLIANNMKRSYLKWNRDSVSDEIIWKNLLDMSNGKLKKPEGATLTDTAEIVRSNNIRKKRPSNRQKNKKK